MLGVRGGVQRQLGTECGSTVSRQEQVGGNTSSTSQSAHVIQWLFKFEEGHVTREEYEAEKLCSARVLREGNSVAGK